jgi:hypothetical protein
MMSESKSGSEKAIKFFWFVFRIVFVLAIWTGLVIAIIRTVSHPSFQACYGLVFVAFVAVVQVPMFFHGRLETMKAGLGSLLLNVSLIILIGGFIVIGIVQSEVIKSRRAFENAQLEERLTTNT